MTASNTAITATQAIAGAIHSANSLCVIARDMASPWNRSPSRSVLYAALTALSVSMTSTFSTVAWP
jgi:hypothetical protein